VTGGRTTPSWFTLLQREFLSLTFPYGPIGDIQEIAHSPLLHTIHLMASHTSAPLKYVLPSNSQLISSIVKSLSDSVLGF
jgi:hypothetical protein